MLQSRTSRAALRAAARFLLCRDDGDGFAASGLIGMLGGLLGALDNVCGKIAVSAAIALADHDAVKEHKAFANANRLKMRDQRLNRSRAEVTLMALVVGH